MIHQPRFTVTISEHEPDKPTVILKADALCVITALSKATVRTTTVFEQGNDDENAAIRSTMQHLSS